MKRIVLSLAVLLAMFVANDLFAQRQGGEARRANSNLGGVPGLSHGNWMSKTQGRSVGYFIWMPPTVENGETRYPVVYFLHGLAGPTFSEVVEFMARVAKAVENGKFPAAIWVLPSSGRSGFRDDFDAMIVDELMPKIDRDYPTQADRSARVIGGFSLGGLEAVRLTVEHPDLFAGAGSWGGSLAWRDEAKDNPLLPIASKNAETLKKNKIALLTINGDQDHPDGFVLLHDILTDAEVPHEMIVLEKTHNNLGKYYQGSGDKMLEFLAERLSAAK